MCLYLGAACGVLRIVSSYFGYLYFIGNAERDIRATIAFLSAVFKGLLQ